MTKTTKNPRAKTRTVLNISEEKIRGRYGIFITLVYVPEGRGKPRRFEITTAPIFYKTEAERKEAVKIVRRQARAIAGSDVTGIVDWT